MLKITNLSRYSIIRDKNPREILLLRGNGCKWKKCRFCDYHLDCLNDDQQNFLFNKPFLDKVTGQYGILEIVNSGSFVELGAQTLSYIENICLCNSIHTLILESHWMYREKIQDFKRQFLANNIHMKVKAGVETFDEPFRESYLVKGFNNASARNIAEYFDQVCLLQGIPGQTASSMISDIETALDFFDRVCVNIMIQNSSCISPDPKVISAFMENVYPLYIKNTRVDILLNNTDFGIGG